MKDDLREELEALREENNQLRRKMVLYKSALDSLNNPVFLKDEELRFVFFNKSYREFFDVEEGQYIGMKVADLPYLSEEEKEHYQKEDERVLATQSAAQYETAFEDPEKGLRESRYWAKGFCTGEEGGCGVIGEIVDVSDEKKMQRELKRYISTLEELMEDTKQTSRIDPATNLYNRHIFSEELPKLVEEMKRTGAPMCALMTDIDNFKSINDTYGHLTGDEVLQSFADVMKNSFRRSDLLIRYGGDEFTAILPGADINVAKPIAERFLDSIRSNVILPSGQAITISVGVAELRGNEELMDFFARTDEALYAAKKSGKNRVVASEG